VKDCRIPIGRKHRVYFNLPSMIPPYFLPSIPSAQGILHESGISIDSLSLSIMTTLSLWQGSIDLFRDQAFSLDFLGPTDSIRLDGIVAYGPMLDRHSVGTL